MTYDRCVLELEAQMLSLFRFCLLPCEFLLLPDDFLLPPFDCMLRYLEPCPVPADRAGDPQDGEEGHCPESSGCWPALDPLPDALDGTRRPSLDGLASEEPLQVACKGLGT